jgi:diacylglycerol O-acyltransferase-1
MADEASTMAAKTEKELRNEIQRLQEQLAAYTKDPSQRQPSSTISSYEAPPEKSGYLFKWQDRSIGWGGTKWGLRFVRLDHGQLSYYKTHEDRSARYVLTLKNCAVRDEGSKVNKRHSTLRKSFSGGSSLTPSSPGKEEEQYEVGSQFYVFSIYRRPNTYEETAAANGDDAAQHDSEDYIIPLLRFSTQSYAEKMQWIDLISQSCAYCDSEEFAIYQQQQQEKAQQQHQEHKKGTLPPLVFEAPPPKRGLQGFPSGYNLSKAKNFQKKSQQKDAARSNTISYPPSKPMHRQSNPSYLSDGSQQNYHGLFNLFLLILVLSNFRLVLHSVSQHGFFLDKIPSFHDFSEAPLDFPFVSGLLAVQAFIVAAYAIEKLMSLGLIGNKVGIFLHVINCNASLGVVMAIVWYLIDHPVVGAGLILQATITWLKLISYAHSNFDYRTAPESYKLTGSLVKDLDESERNISYPQNISLANIYYFWCAPTLTYQIAFPRAPFIQWSKVLRLLVQLFVCVTLVLFLCAQIVAPQLELLVRDLENSKGEVRVHVLGDYLLRLSIASTYIWLLGFFGFFHCFMNITAELLRFGDRVFYKDWWNASEVSSYWRLWNMPVHYWLVRHVYFPSIRIGLSKKGATFVVFFLSAVLHEVLISVPCHMIRAHSFLAMMGQIPLIILTKKIDKRIPGSSIGNIIFWISFCIVGQPMAILLYTIDYWENNHPAESTEEFVPKHGFSFNAIGRFLGASPEL